MSYWREPTALNWAERIFERHEKSAQAQVFGLAAAYSVWSAILLLLDIALFNFLDANHAAVQWSAVTFYVFIVVIFTGFRRFISDSGAHVALNYLLVTALSFGLLAFHSVNPHISWGDIAGGASPYIFIFMIMTTLFLACEHIKLAAQAKSRARKARRAQQERREQEGMPT